MRKRLIIVGGIVNLAFVAFHLALPWLLEWDAVLQPLVPATRATVYTLNLATAFVLLLFAVLSLLGAEQLLDTRTGRLLILGIAGFYLVRAACEYLIYPAPSLLIAAVCVTIAGLYLWPLTSGQRSHGTQHPAAPGA